MMWLARTSKRDPLSEGGNARAALRGSLFVASVILILMIFVSIDVATKMMMISSKYTQNQGRNNCGDDFALARSQSYGFFDDITDENWNILHQIYVEHVNHQHPDKPLMYNPAFERRTQRWWNSPAAWYQNVSIQNNIIYLSVILCLITSHYLLTKLPYFLIRTTSQTLAVNTK